MKKQNRIAFFNILSTLLLRGISIFSGPLFTRLLGTNGYGVLMVYNTWVSVLAIACSLQTQGTLVNARVEFSEEEQPGYQSSVMSLSLLSFTMCGALMAVFAGPVSQALQLSKLLIGLMLFQAFGSFCTNFLNSKFTYEFKADRNMALSVGVAVSTITLSAILVVLLPKEINYYGRILGNALVIGGLGIAASVLVLRRGRLLYNERYWKFCLRLAIPVVCYNLSDLALGHSDLVMLQQLRGESASGIYGYAYQFGGIMFTIFEAVNNSWVPFFFDDMKNGRRQEIRRQEIHYLEGYTVLSVGFILLSREVFSLYARWDFWDGIPLIPVFVASYYLNFLCTFPVNFEYFHKKTNVIAVVTISSAVLNLGLNYVFIQRYGILGAAIATMLSHAFQFACHFLYSRFRLGRGDYPFMSLGWLAYAVCFAGAMAIVYLLPGMWYIRWGLGAALGVWELLRVRKRKSLF